MNYMKSGIVCQLKLPNHIVGKVGAINDSRIDNRAIHLTQVHTIYIFSQ